MTMMSATYRADGRVSPGEARGSHGQDFWRHVQGRMLIKIDKLTWRRAVSRELVLVF